MREPVAVPSDLIGPISRVLEEALLHVDGLRADQVMVVGAWCRDIWHHALSHEFRTAATQDLDLAIAVDDWTTFKDIEAAFPRIGDSGIRFLIAGMKVDVLPFGKIEDPAGTAEPPTRGEAMSVWAFNEVFASSTGLDLGDIGTPRLPTVPGYAATKLAAWLDRSQWNETKDASDIALVMHWYAESAQIQDRLYDTGVGQIALMSEDLDVTRAAAHLLRYRRRDRDPPRTHRRASRTLARGRRHARPRPDRAGRPEPRTRPPAADRVGRCTHPRA